MVQIANTNEKKSNWHISKHDPEVQYLILPLTNIERTEIANYSPSIRAIGAKKDEMSTDVTWVSTMLFRASLKQTVGILDPDRDNAELEFIFHEMKISKRLKVELCQREIYNKIPDKFLGEILEIINAKNEVSEEEEDDINFTSGSSQATSTDLAETATETIPDAPSEDAGTE